MICRNEKAKKDQRGAIKGSSLRDDYGLQPKRDNIIMLSRVKSNANLLLSPSKKEMYIKNKSIKNYKWDAKQLTSISRRQQQDKKIDLCLLLLVPPLFECHTNNLRLLELEKTTSSALLYTEQHTNANNNDDIECLTEIIQWDLVLRDEEVSSDSTI
jgi:hypothetical protein